MRLLGIRFSRVASPPEAEAMAAILTALGLTNQIDGTGEAFAGAVFPTESGNSWAEIWPAGEGMPEGVMLQLQVDDSDAFADRARAAGQSPMGPFEAHGERMYHLATPGGFAITVQSKL